MTYGVKRILQPVRQLVHYRKHLDESFAPVWLVGRQARETARDSALERGEKPLREIEIYRLDEWPIDKLPNGPRHGNPQQVVFKQAAMSAAKINC
jgi:hypothetical protein